MNDEIFAKSYLLTIHHIEIKIRAVNCWIDDFRRKAVSGRTLTHDDLSAMHQIDNDLGEFTDKYNLLANTENSIFNDEFMAGCIDLAVTHGHISVSMIQRTLGCGYSKAVNILDRLEALGVIGKKDGSKPRMTLYKA